MRAFEKRLDVSFFSSFGCEQCELDAALGAVRVHDEIVIEVVDYFQVRVRCFPFPFVQFVERGGDDELAQVARVVLKRSLKRDDDDDFDATRQKESERERKRERERERERESKRYSQNAYPSRRAPEIGLVQRAASTVDHAKRGDARDHYFD
mgnify:CR=1 FL=1